MRRTKGHQGILLPDVVLEIWGPAQPLAGACYGALFLPSLSFLETLLDVFLSSTCFGGRLSGCHVSAILGPKGKLQT